MWIAINIRILTPILIIDGSIIESTRSLTFRQYLHSLDTNKYTLAEKKNTKKQTIGNEN